MTSDLGTVGGAEQFIRTFTRGINRSRFEIIVISLRSKGWIGRAIEREGLIVHALRLNSLHPLSSITNCWRLHRLLKEMEPDIVHSHLWSASYYTRVVNILSTRKMVVTEQNMSVDRRGWQRLIDRALARFTHQFVAVSHSVADFCSNQLDLSRDRYLVIHNAVDTGEFFPASGHTSATAREELGISEEDLVLLNVARMTKQKGHDHLLDAFLEVSCANKRARLLMAGTGALEPSLRRKAEQLRIAGKVDFLGETADVRRLLSASDVFVLPSLWEGLGIALLEAMSMALPVIATSIPPFREIVTHEVSGILVPPKDSHKLAEAVLMLLENTELAGEMGRRGRLTVEKEFSVAQCIKAHEDLYERIADSN